MDFSAIQRKSPEVKLLSGRNFHACLIEGEDCPARDSLTALAVLRLLCTAEEKPCGVCRNCRKFLSDSHPDVVRIDGGISVEEMRRALSGLLFVPNEAPTRVYLIENAQDMSDLVQNILLKPIEEPPEFVAFILVTRRKEALLETVRSRCLVLSVENDAALPVPESVSDFLDSLQAGIFSEAEKFLDFPGREEQRRFFQDCLREVRKRLLDVSRDGREETLFLLARWENIFREVSSSCEYNINVKLWNTVLLSRCFQK